MSTLIDMFGLVCLVTGGLGYGQVLVRFPSLDKVPGRTCFGHAEVNQKQDRTKLNCEMKLTNTLMGRVDLSAL